MKYRVLYLQDDVSAVFNNTTEPYASEEEALDAARRLIDSGVTKKASVYRSIHCLRAFEIEEVAKKTIAVRVSE